MRRVLLSFTKEIGVTFLTIYLSMLALDLMRLILPYALEQMF